MLVVALTRHLAAEAAVADLARHLGVALVDLAAVEPQHDPVVVPEIAHALGEGRQCQRVGADIHRAVAIAHRQRTAATGAHQDIFAPAQQDSQSEGAAQPSHCLGHRLLGRHLGLKVGRQQLGHDFSVSVAVEAPALGHQLVLEDLDILDDSVVHNRHPAGGDRMGVALRGFAVRRPARMADADGATERLLREAMIEIDQLAFGAAALDTAVHQGRDARRIVAAILEPLQGFEQQRRDGRLTDYSDYTAHGRKS